MDRRRCSLGSSAVFQEAGGVDLEGMAPSTITG